MLVPPAEVVRTQQTGFACHETSGAASESVYWRALCLGRNDRALFLLAPHGKIRATNEAGRKCLERSETLCTVQQRLACKRAKNQAAFRSLLGELGAGVRKSAVMRFDENVIMTLDRILNQGAAADDVLVVVYGETPPSPEAPSRWQQLFGLSPAEARVGEQMRRGLDDQSIARELEVTLHTVRGYAKSVHSKTKTHTRAELAYLLSRIVVF